MFPRLTAPRRVDHYQDVLALVVDDGVVVLGRQDLSRMRRIEENCETDASPFRLSAIPSVAVKEISRGGAGVR